uniref:Fer-1-like protein 4 n=1 Tax=Callorhinchus milii TaxID=7868 RepID=A0A4W3JUH3_CALMI
DEVARDFRWPHYGRNIVEETLEIKVYNCSKLFSNRLLGSLVISLQQVIKTGRLILREALVDKNNSLTEVSVLTLSMLERDNFRTETTERELYREQHYSDSQQLDKKTRALGRKLVKEDDIEDDSDEDVDISEVDISNVTFVPQQRSATVHHLTEILMVFMFSQIQVNIYQARKLIGVNIDPVVYVKVGEEKKHTLTQKSTNCPFYNEYFVFEFQEPAAILFDKIIEITVSMKLIIETFFQKWATLTDPKDTKAGIKGFVKCSIAVMSKGDTQRAVSSLLSDENEDIEKNLLLPKRLPKEIERPWAKFYIRIYKAEDLPNMNSGIMGSFSKIIGENKIFIDPYVQVTFAGQQGETSVENNTTTPIWNEQISFIEMFPSYARRIKIQVIDDANINDVAIATHFINLEQISDCGKNVGFHPTFGPAWVPLYGSPQNSVLRDAHMNLNEGLGDGIFYRGRILMAISVDVFSSISAVQSKTEEKKKNKNPFSRLNKKKKSKKSKSKAKEERNALNEEEDGSNPQEQPNVVEVEVEEIHPLPEGMAGQKEEFLLFGSFFEATMIDPSVGSRLLTFEVSIGNYGKLVEVVSKKKKGKAEDSEEKKSLLEAQESEDELENVEVSLCFSRRCYSCIPFLYEKPCVYVWSSWEDYTWRLYNSNILAKIAERLEDGLDEVEHLLKRPKSEAQELLKSVLEGFVAGCRLVVDDELCSTRSFFLPFLQPQPPIADVFIWMLSNGKRVAYTRIPARQILYSIVEEEKGKDCGKIQSVYLKVPGAPIGEIFAKLEIYMWLGITKYVKNNISSLPQEFIPVYEESTNMPLTLPPIKLTSDYNSYFQLRAHIYQARGILAADDNGLSDPFARVVFSSQCQSTKHLEETLSPTWSEMLIFDQILIEGSKADLKNDPPIIIINIFDYDSFGGPEFLGRAFAAPCIKLQDEAYVRPSLKFHDIYKGRAAAGELLAAFELIELDYSGFGEPSLPDDVESKEPEFLDVQKDRFIVPKAIRPKLKKFRIEVLFWGLRDLKRINLFEVEQPQVTVECASQKVESEVITNYKENPNFDVLVKYFEVELPEDPYLHPPLSIFVMERRAFGRVVLVGSHTVTSLLKFSPGELEEKTESEEVKHISKSKQKVGTAFYMNLPLKKPTILKEEPEEIEEKLELDELDWWSKYYASLEELHNKIYTSELENEFHNFEDWLYIFPLYKGKANEDESWESAEERTMGKYKGSFMVYPTNEAKGDFKILQGIPNNRPVKVLIRIYVVKATNLAPADLNGKSDPYIVVKVGEHVQDSKERYIPKQLNPVFGEEFEITVEFPLETELTVSIFDHDMVGKDNLIGETKIDLENRYYSKYRAQCGLPKQYDTQGYNAWRDSLKPTQLLAKLCKGLEIMDIEYRPEEVKVNNKIFKIPNDLLKKNPKQEMSDELKALYVLQHWKEMPVYGVELLMEHVEMRCLYNPSNPGLSQGQVHMWVDMFPVDLPALPPVNIKPRQPVSYELRVIIWNTDDVALDDVNPITGVRSSDIYVKGWIKGMEQDKQETDVHFNSLTGEGNFNWRFVFRFDYLPTEKEIVYKKKESIFSLEESEFRQPAVLMLQVWDYDLISANDFLGSVELKLNNMAKPAKTAEQCTAKMAKDKGSPQTSIIRQKRMKGWWPLMKVKEEEDEEDEEDNSKKKKKKKKNKKKKVKIEDVQYSDSSGNVYILRGKVEAEMQLLTLEEAEKNPVGLARKEPEPLDKPNRPNTSFNWFINPLKSFVYFIWKNYKWYIIGLLILAILVIFIVLILYTMPQFISEKIING